MAAHRKVIVVVYKYFFPGFKAGGPIQSLVNMITALYDQYEFKVITTAFDLNDNVVYPGIQVNAWNQVSLTGNERKIQVWYNATKTIGVLKMSELLKQASPHILFINGLFTPWSFVPLFLTKTGRLKNIRVILSPRGMLQPGALYSKALKKKVFLRLFKMAGLFNDILWHATGNEEKTDIEHMIGRKVQVSTAANIPRKPSESISAPAKIRGELNLVYLSLIAEKKNLLLLIRVLKKTSSKITLDIYGPIKETRYWHHCQKECKELPSNIKVRYKGDIQPHLVQATLEKYHGFISLTKGENFGHALYESLSVGRPLITSHYTPWNDLEVNHAGWNVNIEAGEKISLVLQQIADMDGTALNEFCHGAWDLAKRYYETSDFMGSYQRLFL